MLQSWIDKSSSPHSRRFARQIAALSLPALVIICSGLGQDYSSGEFKNWTLQDYYALHIKHLFEELPAHSGLPPILDLSKGNPPEHQKDRPWEWRSRELMGSTELADRGLTGPAGPTTTNTTIVDGGGSPALPAESCNVVVAKPVTADARIAFNHKLVYSHFELEILQVLKGHAKHGLYAGAHISAIQLGGTIRFPSGHEEAFILVHNGFLEIGKQYILFIWKVNRHVESYGIVNPYLIQDDVVFPMRVTEGTGAYAGMALKDFEAKVKHAIAKNIDTD